MSPERWIDGVRLAAVPFALAEAAVEDYPPGDWRFAWTLAGALAAGALLLPLLRAPAVVALAFDAAVASGFVVLYAFEPATPARELLFLPVLEGGIRLGIAGGLGAALATVPALAAFEARQPGPLDPGHVAFPFGLLVLVALVVGVLAARRS